MGRGCIVGSVCGRGWIASPSPFPHAQEGRWGAGRRGGPLPRPGYPLEIMFGQPLDSPGEELVLCPQPVSSSGQGPLFLPTRASPVT